MKASKHKKRKAIKRNPDVNDSIKTGVHMNQPAANHPATNPKKMGKQGAKETNLSGNLSLDGNEMGLDPHPQDDATGVIKESNDRDGITDISPNDRVEALQNKGESESNFSRSPISSSGTSSSFTAREPASTTRQAKKVASARKVGSPCRENREIMPAPHFYYIDHSRDVDEDPLSPLSPALSSPNFVIKLHAILIRDSLSDVIGWMPHGRSWKILDQPEFEKQVLPTYFNQSSIASFYRQANGWGFRRMLKGPDKGSFYNERFLRGLPFLCKKMKRIGVAKMTEDDNIKHEPMLWKINAQHSTPQNLSTDSLDYIVLRTVSRIVEEGGPKAKMPFVHNIDLIADQSKMKASEKNCPGVTETETTDSSKPRSSSMGTSMSSSASSCSRNQELPVHGGSHPHTQALLQRQQRQLTYGQLTEPYATTHQVQMQQLQSQNQQAISLLLQASNIGSLPSLPRQIQPAPVPIASLQRNQAQQHQSQTQNITNILSSSGLIERSSASAPIASPLQGNPAHTGMPPTNAIANTLCSSLISNPATPADILSSLEGCLSNEIIAYLLHSTGNSASFPQGASDTNSNNIFGQLDLQRTNQHRGLHSTQQSEAMLRNILLQSLAQDQSQPVLRNDARFPQSIYETSSGNNLGQLSLPQANQVQDPHSAQQSEAMLRDILLQILTQNQPQQVPQSTGTSAGFPRSVAETNSTNVLGQFNLQQEYQVQGSHPMQQPEAMLRNMLLRDVTQNQSQPAASSILFQELHPHPVEPSQIQYSPPNHQTSSVGSLLLNLSAVPGQQQHHHQQ